MEGHDAYFSVLHCYSSEINPSNSCIRWTQSNNEDSQEAIKDCSRDIPSMTIKDVIKLNMKLHIIIWMNYIHGCSSIIINAPGEAATPTSAVFA